MTLRSIRPFMWRGVLGIAVLALCAWAASRLDLGDAAQRLRHASLPWILAGVVLNFPLTFVAAVRWRILLDSAARVSTWALFRYLLASHAANSLVPIRPGDLLRIFLSRTRERIPTVTVVSTLVLERLLDALGLLAVTLPLLVAPDTGPKVRLALLGLAGVSGVGLAIAFGLGRRRDEIRRGFLERVRAAAALLHRPRVAGSLGMLTLLYWGLEIVLIAVSLAAVGIPPRFEACALVLLAVNLGTLIQLTPANLGSFEALVVAALALQAVPAAPALAAAVLYHLVQIVPVTLAGLEGLRFLGAAKPAQALP